MKILSVNGERRSALAIVETVAITAVVFYSASRQGIVALAVPALVAPLQLLRTRRSTDVTLSVFRSLAGRLGKDAFGAAAIISVGCGALAMLAAIVAALFFDIEWLQPGRHWSMGLALVLGIGVAASSATLVVVSVLLLVYVFAAALLARAAGILTGLVMHPWVTLAAMPRNWSTQVTRVDLSVLPELVPGIDGDEALADRYSVRGILAGFPELIDATASGIRETMGGTAPAILRVFGFVAAAVLGLVVLVVAALCFAAVLVFSVAARWSIKASALVYLPFLLMTRRLVHRDRLGFQRSIVADSAARWTAAVTLFAQFLGLPLLLAAGLVLADSADLEPLVRAVTRYVAFAPQVDATDVARSCAALLAFVVYLLARRDLVLAGRAGAGLFPWTRRLYLAQVLVSVCAIGLTLRAIFEVVPMRQVVAFLLALLGKLPEALCATTFRLVCP